MTERIVLSKKEMGPSIQGFEVYDFVLRPYLQRFDAKFVGETALPGKRRVEYKMPGRGRITIEFYPRQMNDVVVELEDFDTKSETYRNLVNGLRKKNNHQWMYDDISASEWWE